ncbi:MAG: tRNA (5-methylaminomethyl-2-thiouridine)(34)-methyltransferase MnmD [Sphingobacteriaceae bacterium]|nr:tRNA (5-methylaminomethyl-2-thiouridine)(34)-methyltransferase MnmD [Sphingobacteriaceae bacterium]
MIPTLAHTTLVLTHDGSHSLRNETTGEHYHSIFGAYTESVHVFVDAGLKSLLSPPNNIRLLEVGVGTGLNLLLAAQFAAQQNTSIVYSGLEPYPIDPEVQNMLNYGGFVGRDLFASYATSYPKLLAGECWKTPLFEANIVQKALLDFESDRAFDLIFYDAFSPSSQADMWDEASIAKVASLLAPGGVLVTYCIRGYIRRQFIALGLQAEKLAGPPGKREMMRITKPKHV